MQYINNVLSILFHVYIQVKMEAKSTHVTVVGPILNQLDEKTLQVSFKNYETNKNNMFLVRINISLN